MRFIGKLLRLSAVLALLAVVALVVLVQLPARYVPRALPVESVRYLDQGWGSSAAAPARQAWYYTPQGASLHDLRYDWLVHLEMPWGSRRFADPAHLRAYGFVVDAQPTPANPDQLPVGFARRFEPALGEGVVDLSCAACHTAQLVVERQGRRTAIRVDGGPAAHAFTTARLGHLLPTLTASLASTYFNPLKFRRFGRAVLGERYAAGKWKLHADLGRVLRAFVEQGWHEQRAHLYPVEEGYGRMDGLARGANMLFGAPSGGGGAVRGEAPVRFPYLWDAWKLERLQYEGSASPTLGQRMAKALGAGARVQTLDAYGRPLPGEERFRTSIRIEDLRRMETALQTLQAPRWPEDVLGPIDRARAERGRELFARHCARCHAAVELPPELRALDAPQRTEQDPLWQTPVVPLAEIGTDPAAALELASRTADLRRAGVGREDVQAVFGPVLAEYAARLPRGPMLALGIGSQAKAAVEVRRRREQLSTA
ncbi:MAG TPA: cytochrome c, partial [Vicinamibacteria bacterium]|nr:cytochrome c [Vicinamibacteria bacterium]